MRIKLLIITSVLLSGAACQTTNPTNTVAVPQTNQTVAANTSADHSVMNHNANHATMNHHGHNNLQSAPNAASAEFDLQFLDTMIAHHEGAVEMAKMVEARTNNAELRTFAAKIIADQNREISQMKAWRDEWYKNQPSALNMEMPGMKESMQMNMSKLTAAREKEFDLAFVEMMTPHHVGAVVMSKDALQRAKHAELKTLANEIIGAQNREIEQMRDWQIKWQK